MKKTILILVCGVVALVIGSLALLAGGGWVLSYFFVQSQSETKDLVAVESPDHQYVATGYHVLGGATVANMTIIVVRPKGWKFFDRTNDPVLIADNLSPFQISWTHNRLLAIKCSLERTYSKKTSWRDVSIHYVKD